jgi:hypothetical protein
MNDEQITIFVHKMLITTIIADYYANLKIVDAMGHD